ncbi:hypothetical protein [Actinocorallia populi]|uniref:hypothetical protein n=1 Tax=Actinocorallia populi TaxID=2079200 RepID=UPI0013007790|nr:hypothetical protein [Actinocorallia populi]
MKTKIRSLAAASRAERVLLATALVGLAVQLVAGNGRMLANVLIVGIAAAVLVRRDVAVRVAPLWREMPGRLRVVLLAPAVVLFLATSWPWKVAFGLTVLSVVMTVLFWFLTSTAEAVMRGETD